MSFWNKSTGEQTQAQDSFESSGGEPIPEKTVVPAVASEMRWDSYDGERYVNARFEVVDGQYKGRVVFLKLKFEGTDKQRDRALDILATMDVITGAGLMQLPNEPSDMDLSKVCNKPMDIRLMVWEQEDKDEFGNVKKDANGKPVFKRGNWVQAVAKLGALSGAAVTPAPVANTHQATAAAASQVSSNSVPF